MWLMFSLLAAFCFGVRGILYQWTSRKPINRNLMLFGVFLMGAAASACGMLLAGESWRVSSLIGCLMGFWSFIGNAAMYRGFALGKASLVALFTALPPVVVVCTSFLLWGQTLTLPQLIAFAAILGGVLLIRYSSDIGLENTRALFWATVALLGFGFNDTTSTQAMRWDAPLFHTMFFMFAIGTLLFGASWLIGSRRAKARLRSIAGLEMSAGAERPEWRIVPTVMWGMAVGTTNFFGMIFILRAFDLGIAGLVSAVTSLNVLLILIYAGLVLKERYTMKEWIGGLLALSGVLILRLAS
jgi:drug/metabolite transporter (DMT)-like permease